MVVSGRILRPRGNKVREVSWRRSWNGASLMGMAPTGAHERENHEILWREEFCILKKEQKWVERKDSTGQKKWMNRIFFSEIYSIAKSRVRRLYHNGVGFFFRQQLLSILRKLVQKEQNRWELEALLEPTALSEGFGFNRSFPFQ